MRYEFADPDGARRTGSSWLPAGALQPGDQCGVVHLPNDPSRNRLRGGTSSLAALRLPLLAGVLLLPALAVGLLWSSRALRTFVLLRHGDGARATLVAQRPLRGWPLRIRVRYAFAGDGGARGGSRCRRGARGASRTGSRGDSEARWNDADENDGRCASGSGYRAGTCGEPGERIGARGDHQTVMP